MAWLILPAVLTAVPVALLPVGSFRASWKYDAEFLKRLKK